MNFFSFLPASGLRRPTTAFSSSNSGFHSAFSVIARFVTIINPRMHSNGLTGTRWTWWRVTFGPSAAKLLDTSTIRTISGCISTVAGVSGVVASSTTSAAFPSPRAYTLLMEQVRRLLVQLLGLRFLFLYFIVSCSHLYRGSLNY